ncbi:MAG: flagellar export chaperone FliS [Oscillospiraceae bacterium]|nr:flagellar export chaperone FliS [Oscillospiraceae bacterium]
MQQMVMLNTRPQDAYRKQDVLTASPVDLVVMLYDALKRNIVMGKRGIINKNVPTAHKHLMKAQMILTELINSLDMNYQISEELLDLYEFALKSIADANMHKNVEPLDPIIEMVDSIREAWKEISNSNRGTMQLGEERA